MHTEKKKQQDTAQAAEASKSAEGTQGANTAPGAEDTLDVGKLSLKDLRVLAKALIEENTQLEQKIDEFSAEYDAVKKKAEKAAQLTNMYNSLSRDFDSYRNRNKDIEKDSYDNAVADVALQVVPVLENLKLAISAITDTQSRSGIEMIVNQFESALKKLNVVAIDAEGQKFDPFLHAAVMAEETDEPDLKGTVKTQFSGGYVYKEKVIKQSQVIVYKD